MFHMNIADKSAFYREIRRVLNTAGCLARALGNRKGRGRGAGVSNTLASSARTSFLSTPEETRRGLSGAGFDVIRLHSTLEEARAYSARARAIVERGARTTASRGLAC